MAKRQPPFNLRCITAGLDLFGDDFERRVQHALQFLCTGRELFQSHGYTVQMIRMATNPFPDYLDWEAEDPIAPIKAMSSFCEKNDITLSIGPVIRDDSEKAVRMDLFFKIMAETSAFSSIVMTDPSGRIFRKAVRTAASAIAGMAKLRPMSNFHFAATAGIPPDTPFFPASYHDGGPDCFTLGTESAGLVTEVFEEEKSFHHAGRKLAARLDEEFSRLEDVSLELSRRTGWTYAGLDTSPAPMKDVSIGRAIENLTGVPFGSSGTMSACALITDVIKSVPVRQAGYCGLMLPVMEDQVLADRAVEGRYGLIELMSYSAVCGTGLDVIPLPGTTSSEQLERILMDLCALSVKLKKPLSARLIPIPGRESGEIVILDSPYLVPTSVFQLK